MEEIDNCGTCSDNLANTQHSEFPDHSASKKRINRAKGQLDAVARMIDERRYCPDIIQQIRAATNAMKALEQEVLRGHLESCVKAAFQSQDPSAMKSKVEEIMKLVGNV